MLAAEDGRPRWRFYRLTLDGEGALNEVRQAHVATAFISLVPIAIFLVDIRILADTATAVALFALVMPYAFSWIGIGWTLIRQTSSQRGSAAGV